MAMSPELPTIDPEKIDRQIHQDETRRREREQKAAVQDALESTGAEEFGKSKIPSYFGSEKEKTAFTKEFLKQDQSKSQEEIARFNIKWSTLKETPILLKEEAQAADALFNDAFKNNKAEDIPISEAQYKYLERSVISDKNLNEEKRAQQLDALKNLMTVEVAKEDMEVKKEPAYIPPSPESMANQNKGGIIELTKDMEVKGGLTDDEKKKAKILFDTISDRSEGDEKITLNSDQYNLVLRYAQENTDEKQAIEQQRILWRNVDINKTPRSAKKERTREEMKKAWGSKEGRKIRRNRQEIARKKAEHSIKKAQYPKSKLDEELPLESLKNMDNKEAIMAIRSSIKDRLKARGIEDDTGKRVNQIIQSLEERGANLRGEVDPLYENRKELENQIDELITQGTSSLDDEIAKVRTSLKKDKSAIDESRKQIKLRLEDNIQAQESPKKTSLFGQLRKRLPKWLGGK